MQSYPFGSDEALMIRNLLLSSSALLLCSPGAHAQSETPASANQERSSVLQARITRVERGLSTPVVIKGAPDQKMTLAERMAFYRVPAVSIALINDGRVEWARAYGVADNVTQLPVTITTLFQAGSISKSLTAIGALRLVEQHKLSLDEDANRQLTGWKIPQSAFTDARPVTLRMLLNHSAGVTVHGFDGYAQGQPLPTLIEVLNGAKPANSEPIRVDVAPGSVWRYSGGGYEIVQLMMSEATGQSFDRYMKTEVLDRMGLSQSTFGPLPEGKRRLAVTAHHADGTAVDGRWHVYPESSAAGLWSTPSDLARVVIAVQRAEAGQSDAILSRPMASAMLKRELGEYGLGFFVEDVGGYTSFGHSGGTDGFKSQIYGYTGSGQGAVVMTNSDNGAALIAEILGSIAAEYGWPEFKVIEKTALKGDAENNVELSGEYQLLDRPVHIVAEADRLYFQSDLFGTDRMELFLQSKDTFFMTAQDMTIRFERSDNTAVVGFSLLRGSNTYTARKR